MPDSPAAPADPDYKALYEDERRLRVAAELKYALLEPRVRRLLDQMEVIAEPLANIQAIMEHVKAAADPSGPEGKPGHVPGQPRP